MLVVAERLNCTRKRVREAVEARNAEFVRCEARRQAEAGGDYVDVNSATSVESELADMRWMIEQVRAATDKPLSIDTASPTVMRAGLSMHGPGQPMLNSLTAERERLETMMPLAAEFQTKVVALAMDDSGMPETVEGRLPAIEKLLAAADKHGVKRENVYVDPLVRPVSINPCYAVQCLAAIRRIKVEFGPVQTIGGLSNVSFGLPKRGHLNRVFVALAMEAGIDAGLIDPLEPGMMATIRAAEAVLARDEFCLAYITADRQGRLQ